MFIDDKQLLASAPVAEAHEAKNTVEQCTAAIKDWLSTRHLQQLAGINLNLSIGSDIIRPSTVVRDMGVLADAERTFCEHVLCVTSSCFFHLRRLCQIRKHIKVRFFHSKLISR